MAYSIYRSDGTAVTIPDNAISATFYNAGGGGGFGPGNIAQAGHGLGTQLVGRNTTDYGAAIAQNFLQLQENFSSSIVPSDATSLQGQLWFKQNSTTTGELYVRTSSATSGGIANWQKLMSEDPSGNLNITGSISASSGKHVPVVYSSTAVPGIAGDLAVVAGVIYVFNGTDWKQIFPAVYS